MRGDFEVIKARAMAHWERLSRPTVPRIIVGTGACGLSVGAEEVFNAIQQELQRHNIEAIVSQTGCNGMCYAEVLVDIMKPGGPCVTYGHVTPELVPLLIGDCLLRDELRPDLAVATTANTAVNGIPAYDDIPFFKYQQRIITRNCGRIDPESIDEYIANGGYTALVKALFDMKPEEVIAEVKESGLMGRGGAAFPTGRKWESSRAVKGHPKYVICNAEEGEPAVYKDRRLMESDPQRIIEGMLIGAYAVGSDCGYIYIGGEHDLAARRMAVALEQAHHYGLLGHNILGSGFSYDILLRRGAGSYAAGESSAQMSSLEAKRGMPRPKLVRSVERGLWAKPTLMNNVETFANIPDIIEKGGVWYASIGTAESKGTKLFALSGHIRHPGLVEVPFGVSLRRLVFDIGGGIPGGKPFKAAQPGGPSGGCLPASLLDIPLSFESLEEAGSAIGSGGLVIMDESVCMVDMSRYFIGFSAAESCGRCTTCRIGCQRLQDIVTYIAEGLGRLEELDLLEAMATTMKETALCGLGQTAAVPLLCSIRHFRAEYEAHILEKRCPANFCRMRGEGGLGWGPGEMNYADTTDMPGQLLSVPIR
ncbi:MAG: NADH-quinone oxidoreductase subunit F [Chloroflexi bacterium]|nr:NADH-quinone oxidoreductase subunit F [Chloroflexota bacterium]MCL5075029.1 NADH-quinone oxidoreductase subunit F [Chloroflexota bacterium]